MAAQMHEWKSDMVEAVVRATKVDAVKGGEPMVERRVRGVRCIPANSCSA